MHSKTKSKKINLCDTCNHFQKIQVMKNGFLEFSKEENLCRSTGLFAELEERYNAMIEFPILVSGITSKCKYHETLLDKSLDKTLDIDR